ncbi:cell division protein FtsQ [Nocardioides panzhihuensis]|uniref:cell division protein FtsQ n=1 Tax=Nocardioides panzhihuensis TaxID=860243 RepID=UPI0015CEC600|nr:cell division protein FtsQ [Nocardioides panzhihuensis]
MSGVDLRVVRPTRGSVWLALLAAVEITTGSSLAHLAGGGELPDALWLAATGFAAFGVGVVVLQRRVGIALGAVLAGAAQLGMHEAFEAYAAPAAHAHNGAAGEASMLLAHTAAAALTVVVWLLHRRAWRVISHALTTPQVLVPFRLPVQAQPVLPRTGLWTYVAAGRGPPVLA